jgi:ABC-type antimicrobial peptide transport system permease subunit
MKNLDVRYRILHLAQHPRLRKNSAPAPSALHARHGTTTVAFFAVKGSNVSLLVSTFRSVLAELVSGIPVLRPITLRDQMLDSAKTERLVTILSTFLGVLALMLTAISLFGLMAWRVSRQISEIGVRMALGAARRNILWMILRKDLLPVSVGIFAGLAGYLGVGFVLRSMLYEVKDSDPRILLGSIAVMIAVALIACWKQAHRACGADPLSALRYE